MLYHTLPPASYYTILSSLTKVGVASTSPSRRWIWHHHFIVLYNISLLDYIMWCWSALLCHTKVYSHCQGWRWHPHLFQGGEVGILIVLLTNVEMTFPSLSRKLIWHPHLSILGAIPCYTVVCFLLRRCKVNTHTFQKGGSGIPISLISSKLYYVTYYAKVEVAPPSSSRKWIWHPHLIRLYYALSYYALFDSGEVAFSFLSRRCTWHPHLTIIY